MSELETASREVLEPLLRGARTRSLSVSEQKEVAGWCYKTGLMLALTSPLERQHVPREDYEFFYRERRPADGTCVWLARTLVREGEQNHVAWSNAQRLDFKSKPAGLPMAHGYRLVFSVMHLAVEIVRNPHGRKLTRPKWTSEVWTRIRPISPGAWPPRLWLAPEHVRSMREGQFFSYEAE